MGNGAVRHGTAFQSGLAASQVAAKLTVTVLTALFFKECCVYLKSKVTGKEEGQRSVHCFTPNLLQQTGLGQAEARSQELLAGLSHE